MFRTALPALLAGILAGCAGSSPVASRVERVEAGDLLVLRSGERLRLANVKAPSQGDQGFDESKAMLERIVKDKTLSISRIGEADDGSIIAEITVQGVSVSKMMEILGMVESKTIRPVAKRR
jgi:hypothetical protein